MANSTSIQITADTKQAETALQGLDKSFGNLKGSIENMAHIGGAFAALPNIIQTVDALYGAVKNLTVGGIAYMASLHDMSQQTGASVESLSAMKLAAKLAGTDLETVAGGIQKLSINIGDARLKSGGDKEKLFTALGIDVKTVTDSGQAMMDIAVKLAAMGDQTKAIAIARQLFGKSVSMPFLYELAEQGKLVAKVTSLQAAEADKFQDSMIKLQGGVGKLGIAIGTALLPHMNDITEAMLEARKEGGLLYSTMVGLGMLEFKLLGIETNPLKRAQNEALSLSTELTAKQQRAAEARKEGGLIGSARADWIESDLPEIRARLKAKNASIARLTSKSAEEFDAEQARIARRKKSSGLPDGILDSPAAASKSDGDGTLERLRLEARAKDVGLDAQTVKELDAIFAASNMTLAERNRLIEVALANDKVLGEEQKVIAAALKERAQAEQIVANYDKQFATSLERIDRQNELIGLTGREVQVKQALNKVEDEAQRVREELTRQVKDEIALKEKLAEVEAGLAGKKQLVTEATLKAYDASRTFNAGWSDAFAKYEDSATNAADTARNAFAGMTGAMEGAIRSFVKNGKVDFRSFGDSVINTLIDIQMQSMRTQVLAPMMQSAGGWLQGLFGGGAEAKGAEILGNTPVESYGFDPFSMPSFAVGTDYVPKDMLAMIHEGEKITPKAFNPAAGNGGGSGGNIEINIHNTNASNTQATATTRQDAGGKTIIDVLIATVKNAMVGDIGQGGEFAGAMEAQYGLNRAPGAWR